MHRQALYLFPAPSLKVKERSSCAVEAPVVEMSTEGRSLQHSETAVCTGFVMNLSILHRQYATCQKELKEPGNNTSNEP